MISHEALDNFHKLVQIAGDPCKCEESDLGVCRGCLAREGLERITMEIADIMEDINFDE